jgi:hypothetical protein
VATAPVTIGGVTENIKFMVITNVSCLPQIPDCPKNAFTVSGRAGLMGISLYIGGKHAWGVESIVTVAWCACQWFLSGWQSLLSWINDWFEFR